MAQVAQSVRALRLGWPGQEAPTVRVSSIPIMPAIVVSTLETAQTTNFDNPLVSTIIPVLQFGPV
jgi:hypothetical protein